MTDDTTPTVCPRCHKARCKCLPPAEPAPPVCDTCGGEGRITNMVCYGMLTVERQVYCPDCAPRDLQEREFI